VKVLLGIHKRRPFRADRPACVIADRQPACLVIENSHAETFSQYDEHLMVVIASHLAGLIEYTRLREEAEGRARSLGLIHEVVQQVIGLNDKKEVASITAELVAQYFKYELAAILLMDGRSEYSIQGIGGTQAQIFKEALGDQEFLQLSGVTGHVSRKGESVLLNDTTQSKLYKPSKGWDGALGNMCCRQRTANKYSVLSMSKAANSTLFHITT
jgi:GAF domain-containing protein